MSEGLGRSERDWIVFKRIRLCYIGLDSLKGDWILLLGIAKCLKGIGWFLKGIGLFSKGTE